MIPTAKPRPRPRPRPAAEVPADAPSTCNLTGCDAPPEWRGLCSAHRQTHRGLAGPKEDR